MANDGLFPKWLAAIHPVSHVPVRAMLIQGVAASVLATSGTFDQLTDYVVFSSWLWYGLAAAGLFRLRKRDGNFTGYKIKYFPLVPGLFTLCSIWLMLQAIYSNPQACLIGALIILAGVPFYLVLYRGKTKLSAT